MSNRRISEFPPINGLDIVEQDLLTIVHVFEVDPVLRNKRVTFTEFKNYLDQYYPNGSGGTFSGNVIINGDLTVTGTSNLRGITGLDLATFSGVVVQNNLTTTGTISGTTFTGTSANFTSGNFSNLNSAAATISGALVMANQQPVMFREAIGNGTNHIALQASAAVSSDQVITLPDQTGTVVTTGDNGSVTSTMILDGTIDNSKISASAEIATSKLAFTQAGTGAVTRAVEGRLRETVSVLDFIPVAEHAAIRAGTSTYDCKPVIQAAITYLSTLFGRGKLFFPDGRYQVDSVITQPTGITLEGPVAPWTDVAGITWNSGAVLYKAHNGDCIQSGISSQVVGVAIKNLAIQSNSTTYPSGAGINYGKVVEARLDGVNVFRVGGDGIVFGDNSTDTWHSYMNDCYVNNPGGRAFVIGTKWFRGKNIHSDAGTVACELLTGAQEVTLEAFHFEGWSQNALKISGGNIQTTGRCISANTFAGSSAVHIDFMNVSGAFITTLRGVHFFGASSRAVRLNGTQNDLISVEACSIESAAVGVDVNGGDNCSIRNNNFYQCGYAFRQNASGLIFTGNTTSLTANAQVGEFVSGSNSSYTNNLLDKQLNSSGLILASNTNTASGNKGWVTKSGGTTAAVTSGTAVPHGLPGQPTEVYATPTTGGWTSFHITSDATNIYFNHVGISNVQYHWAARLACDRQS